MRPLDILTWHVHGSYLDSLAQLPHRLHLPVTPERGEGYGGRSASFDWGPNVIEVAAREVRNRRYDAILFQSRCNWEVDQFEILTPAQRLLPRLYVEHDPPRDSPTDTAHPVDDPDVMLVHVTHFNALMWDSGDTPVTVIEHGVRDRGHLYRGDLPRGLVVVNGLARRGRRLGADIFTRAAQVVPLDLVGMFADEAGGIGEVPPRDLAAFSAPYRFFFHPIRYTSLGLALCEAMMAGLPPVALATTEAATIIRDSDNGFAATSETLLYARMRTLIDDPALARRLGQAARMTALERFGIGRFVEDWNRVLNEVIGQRLVEAA